MDLSKYREDGTTQWYVQECERIGENALMDMQRNIYAHILELNTGDIFHIPAQAQPQNYQIVVRTACEMIQLGLPFEFTDNTYTTLKRYEKTSMDRTGKTVRESKCWQDANSTNSQGNKPFR